MRYVGVSGFMSRAEVNAALAALPVGLTLMCGALVSAKTLRGERNKYPLRYPRVEDIANIFSDDPRCLNLINYSSDSEPSAADVARLQTLSGPRCHGFQFNGVLPSAATLSALAGGTVVLQLRTELRTDGDLTPEFQACRALRGCDVHILIDGSGGRGVPIDATTAALWADCIRNQIGSHVGLAFAGGFNAARAWSMVAPIRKYRASIDAEGGLRDGPDGGVLNVDAMREYLQAAGEVML